MTEYILRINSNNENYSKITDILNVKPSENNSYWEFSIDENDHLYTSAINYFMDLIEDNKNKLNSIGITSESISVWFYKPYSGQCNLEFTPKEMERLSFNSISLCISCWETN